MCCLCVSLRYCGRYAGVLRGVKAGVGGLSSVLFLFISVSRLDVLFISRFGGFCNTTMYYQLPSELAGRRPPFFLLCIHIPRGLCLGTRLLPAGLLALRLLFLVSVYNLAASISAA